MESLPHEFLSFGEAAMFDESVREHLMRDYVDELTYWAVGEDCGAQGEQMRCWAEGDTI